MGRSIYKRKWYVQKCRVPDCWCRMIVLSSYSPATSRLDDCVVCAGELTEDLAHHIVNLHNQTLKRQ